MTVSIATRILITNLSQIDLSKVCLINLVYFKGKAKDKCPKKNWLKNELFLV